MRTDTSQKIRLSDYAEPPFWIDTIELTFQLHPTRTQVISRMCFYPNEARPSGPHSLRLDGKELNLIWAKIDGQPLDPDTCATGPEHIEIPADQVPQDGFTWEAEVEINPEANTSLDGLYMSNGMYCTQCEAEGFRKITYSLDRPDVMATYDVRIECDQPILLSNGNSGFAGDTWAEWHDPWPKPAYLFALVAGDLRGVDAWFTTASGRKVQLIIWVRPGDEDKCDYALDALQRSMRWDEKVYGREYDLDVFNVVAVDDFNMGAMENKGLNIFNSKYVLVSPDTATDRDYELVEGIIAHEYFHNWTGNRITCRDWFQLCLKEGLTVFRDQQFSGDQRSHGVKRIDDVKMLRARQFREDAGPLAHPVRPEEYIEINNFYTATVYEKGAEVIGMLKLLVGDDAYAKALDLFFNRHDGQACTIEDWIKVFEDATGRDLAQFKLWYSQAGTPKLDLTDHFEGDTLTVTLRQSLPDTPGQTGKAAQVIPVRLGFLAEDGSEARPEETLILTELEQSWRFEGLTKKPTLSPLRGFSAPVVLDHNQTAADRAFLLSHDSDPFNRWEAGYRFGLDLICDMVAGDGRSDAAYLDAMHKVAFDASLDPAFRALVLSLPSEDAVMQAMSDRGVTTDPARIHLMHGRLTEDLAHQMAGDLPDAFQGLAQPGPYTPDAASAGARALRSKLLRLICETEEDCTTARAVFAEADNMTEAQAALTALIAKGMAQDELSAFYDRWQTDKLVTDKWFALQVAAAPADQALAAAERLVAHPAFDFKNPNRFRSVVGVLPGNHAGFHRADGEGYRFVADWLIKLDAVNPQTTARLAGAFEVWRRYDTDRQALMRAALERIANTSGLSRNTAEIVSNILG